LILHSECTEYGTLRVTFRRLDFDDLGSPVGHDSATGGTGNPDTEFDDPNPGKGPGS
jgi:hypothetical protein